MSRRTELLTFDSRSTLTSLPDGFKRRGSPVYGMGAMARQQIDAVNRLCVLPDKLDSPPKEGLMDRLWKVRFITDKGEACYTFANAEDARLAAEVFAAYPNPHDIVIIETPDRRFVPADRLELIQPTQAGSPDSHAT